MSRFVCKICNRDFTTKYGLQKHSNKKIPCTTEKKTKHQCNICNKFLSSKQNLDNHLFNHRLNNIRKNAEDQNNINLEDNLTKDNLIEDNLTEDNPINILPNNSIKITIEEYNYLKSLENKLHKANDEINKLKDKIDNTIVSKNNTTNINNIDNSINNIDNSIDNSTNIINNNIQINIIPFYDDVIDFKHIVDSFNDPNSALHDFSKIFNYEHLNYPKIQNGLSFSQKCKEEKLRKIVASHRKKDIALVSRGFCDVLNRHYSKLECRNIILVTRNLFKLYNGNNTWILITLDDTKNVLDKKIVKSIADNYISNSMPKLDRAMKFIKNDHHKNHQEYLHYHHNEFINVIKRIQIN